MTTEQFNTPDSYPDGVTDDGVSDVLTEDEVVHVPAVAAEMSETLDHPHAEFLTDIPDWDAEDPQP